MRRKLKHAIKNERTTLKEAVAPVPAVILDHMVRFRFDPEVECDEDDTTDPAGVGQTIISLACKHRRPRQDSPQHMNKHREP